MSPISRENHGKLKSLKSLSINHRDEWLTKLRNAIISNYFIKVYQNQQFFSTTDKFYRDMSQMEVVSLLTFISKQI